jgi:hypothetical protein
MDKKVLTQQESDYLYKDFPIKVSVCRADLACEDYDISNITDETMKEIADDMIDGLMDDYWVVLFALAEKYNIKKK